MMSSEERRYIPPRPGLLDRVGELYTRLSVLFPNQFREPQGRLGRVVGYLESRRNETANDFTLFHLQVQPGDHVLEAGYGPGRSIARLARLVEHGWVAGIDYSAVMAAQARQANRKAMQRGRVMLNLGKICQLPYCTAVFDKILAVSVVYFFPEPLACLAELRRVLVPGGRLAFYLTSKEDLLKVAFTQKGKFQLYTGEELVDLLLQAGFGRAWYETTTINKRTGLCVLAEKT